MAGHDETISPCLRYRLSLACSRRSRSDNRPPIRRRARASSSCLGFADKDHRHWPPLLLRSSNQGGNPFDANRRSTEFVSRETGEDIYSEVAEASFLAITFPLEGRNAMTRLCFTGEDEWSSNLSCYAELKCEGKSGIESILRCTAFYVKKAATMVGFHRLRHTATKGVRWT